LGPIKTVHVAWGKIGYRAVGQGRPLVLVTGGSASIDDWAPSFIDLLARHHLVLALDNPGVGRTTLRRGKLTIARWAGDVSDFIAALHLKRPDVLGWSTGGEVVEALAVLHPGSVRRIILCATFPGDGSLVLSPIPRRTSPPFVNFFPADQNAARLAFIRDIHRYRHFYIASKAVTQLQAAAGIGWGLGQEPAGHQLNRVNAPVLIADGNHDPNDAVANSQTLAGEIPHSQLHIYPDAAHGFWFQDRTDWVRRIDRFLG
jgi:pimeloyl-ACP methyl ester carboxylesterase